jgi:uncharacterized protein
MQIRSEFPRPTRTIANTFIPLADGTKLAARIWLPEDAEADPVPAILEYIPYRKDDGTAARDALMHPWWAGHGYANVRVDQRGSGDSDGIILDEYTKQEHDDALEVLAWLAAQPWCTGKVGIIGKSWGGFNGLQIAARRPPELAGVISVASTDDRYATDIHYIGGALHGFQKQSWASTMLAYNARPPDPLFVGDRWREMWLERLDRTPPFLHAWVSHQRRDEFWKHGSVCEDYSDIEVPVYMVGGWQDGYTDAIFRFMEGYGGQSKGLCGPWGHVYPQSGLPKPAIGFLQDSLRFWDRTLKGIDNGMLTEPPLTAWIQEWVEPADAPHVERPGRWVTETAWPPVDRPEPATLHLRADGGLDEDAGPAGELPFAGLQHAGLDAGAWTGWGFEGDDPPDQRAEDGRSLCFTSAPLPERAEMLGFPEARLTLASDRPLALVAVRVCDVSPEGVSLLVSRGFLNLTHRDSHEHPEPLEPGRAYEVAFRLTALGHAFQAGHRIRVSLSPTYWPFMWPSPDPVTLTVHAGAASSIAFPARPPRAEDDALPPFEEPEVAQPLEIEHGSGGGPASPKLTIDRGTGRATLSIVTHDSSDRLVEADLVVEEHAVDTYSIVEGDPLSAETRADWTIGLSRGDWRTKVKTASVMTSDRDAFLLTDSVEAYEGDHRIFSRSWTKRIPRDHI